MSVHRLHRRGLLALGAAIGAVGAAPAAVARQRDILLSHQRGEVVLTGRAVWGEGVRPHYLTLMAEGDQIAVRILPRDLRRMAAGGRVTVRGRLQVGTFPDAVTGRVAEAILLDARPA